MAFVYDDSLIAGAAVFDVGVYSAGSGIDCADSVWSYVMTNGNTAHQNVVEIHAMLSALTLSGIADAVWNKDLP